MLSVVDCFELQRTYGRSVADVQVIAKGFMKILSDYKPDEVVKGIRSWILQSPELPTPSDIVKIIEQDRGEAWT